MLCPSLRQGDTAVVFVDLEEEPDRAAELCVAAQARLLADVAQLSDGRARAASRLPGWSVGHVLTHLARNADAHGRRLAGALRGEDVPKYPGGAAQRAEEIDQGAGRPAAAIVADLAASQARLEELMAQCSAAGWPGGHLRADNSYSPRACPAHRLREVEMHHVDLGIGYEPRDWPDEYVAWDLTTLLLTVPERLPSSEQRRTVMAWLAGRADMPTGAHLEPWG